MVQLHGKVAIVTGAARGIGAGIAAALAEAGASVVLADLDVTAAEAQVEALKARGGRVLAIGHDVADEGSWNRLIDQTESALGPLDILVNNAGIMLVRSILDTSLKDFQSISKVNTDGVFLGIKAAVQSMKAHGGSIINVSSLAAMVGVADQIAYSATKGAIRAMTKCVVAESAAYGFPIRCNSLHPGVMHTPMAEEHYGFGSDAKVETLFGAMIPFGRVGTAADVGAAAVFLASDGAAYINGAELVIDGGLYAAPVQKPRESSLAR